ncbi:hypothetical protein BKA63DRAFT_402597 [Paraphoma chrysanthemicola]|nr:hypothetical protein BKA63DRAFT_402597 [Paraphoma chrysanthemicola]
MNRNKLTFHDVVEPLSMELVLPVLKEWMSPQTLVVETFHVDNLDEDDPIPTYINWLCTTDAAADDPSIMPHDISDEYWHTRHKTFLEAPKVFTTGHDFWMTHAALAFSQQSPLPAFNPATLSDLIYFTPEAHYATLHPIITSLENNGIHGLEKVVLDLSATEYFAIFHVTLPPFNIKDTQVHGDDLYPDERMHGAAGVLEHTQSLTLVFGEKYKYAHAWSDVRHHDFISADATCRPNVCDSGLIVDWILEYAWSNKFLQHIPEVRFEGAVQGWVKEKWEGIFEAWREWEVYKPEEHFPPRCECKVPCGIVHGYGDG